jgi:hypothetical protein
MNRTSSLAFVLAGLLSACGGGGGGDSVPPPPPAGCTAASFEVSADSTVAVGKAAGASIASACGALTNVVWRQTEGPDLALISARTQAISFEPASAGAYGFTVDFRDPNGTQRSLAVTVNAVPAASPVGVLVRADQAVREGGKASVRAWPAATAGETITWTQVSGPSVTLDAGDPNRVLFTAPAVSADSLIVLRATRQLVGGGTDSDDVRVLVENHEQAPPDPSNTGPYVFSDTHVSRAYPYRAGGPFAAALVSCTYESSLQYFGAGASMCPLSTLPFLHQTTGGAVPTVSQIMDRVVVSHDWMGEVFEAFLTTQASDDLKRLFNGVTAIVIGAHVRPSFYYALTGAIYLDADNFWLTAEQRDVIDETPDFRSDFDRELNYSSVWRYTENSRSIFVNFEATSRIARTQSYLLAEAGWLLYHELAHASDFLPPSERSRLNDNLSLTAWGFIEPLFSSPTPRLPSSVLASTYALHSSEVTALAQVKFFGAAATDLQKSYTPDQVAAFFAPDRATDEYNYATTREDLAMLFEEFMMYRNSPDPAARWRRNVAITDKITDATTSETLIVRWGQRGRVGETAVRPRAQLVVGALAPWVPPAEIENLPPPILMRPGESWASNLVLPAPPSGLASVQSVRTPLDLPGDRALLSRGRSSHRDHWTPNERWLKRAGR